MFCVFLPYINSAAHTHFSIKKFTPRKHILHLINFKLVLPILTHSFQQERNKLFFLSPASVLEHALRVSLFLPQHFSKHSEGKVKSPSCVRLFVTRGLQPTKLLPPWDSPGKNTGVGCHFLLKAYPFPKSTVIPEKNPHDSICSSFPHKHFKPGVSDFKA